MEVCTGQDKGYLEENSTSTELVWVLGCAHRLLLLFHIPSCFQSHSWIFLGPEFVCIILTHSSFSLPSLLCDWFSSHSFDLHLFITLHPHKCCWFYLEPPGFGPVHTAGKAATYQSPTIKPCEGPPLSSAALLGFRIKPVTKSAYTHTTHQHHWFSKNGTRTWVC